MSLARSSRSLLSGAMRVPFAGAIMKAPSAQGRNAASNNMVRFASSSSANAPVVPAPKGVLENLLYADVAMGSFRVYHKTHYAALAAVPIAFLAHPSALSMPADLVLSILLPAHAHIGMNWVFTDYVPGRAARIALLAVSTLTTLGLLKLTFAGPGVVGTVKEMWTGAEHELKHLDVVSPAAEQFKAKKNGH